MSTSRPPLNEGRPCRAGNPVRRQVHGVRARHRSTKAGPAGPATRDVATSTVAQRPIAQRRPALPGRQPGLGDRSPRRRMTTLNEGRPCRAGNPFPVHGEGCSRVAAQRRPALPGRQPCPTSTIEALRHSGNTGERAKGAEKQQSRLRLASVLKDHSRFADRYRTHGSPNSRDRGRPSVVRDSWIGPAKR